MSYQVFARKYRPQNFDSVIGQDHITRTLKNAIEQNRLAHAYLFVGPRGTGKTSTARILAKALNCVKGPTVNPCGECDVCREIAQGISMDVLEIDGASNNGVEQVRELRENVRFSPTRGKFKIYIIDEVHMLTPGAFNALLKTLEEPPAHVKFVFATTEPQKVLPTILSRCQRFDLRRIPAPLITAHLKHISQIEGFELEDAAAAAIANGAEGGLRDAESMLDQLVAFCGDHITEQDVLSIFGFPSYETIATLCQRILAEDCPGALSIVYEQAGEGRDLGRLMSDLIGYLRDLLIVKTDPSSLSGSDIDAARTADLAQSAAGIRTERILELIEQFALAEGRMKWAPNKKLHFEIATIKAIQTLSHSTLGEIVEALAAIKEGKEPSLKTPKPPVQPSLIQPRPPAPKPVQPKITAPKQKTEPAVSPLKSEPPVKPDPKPEAAATIIPAQEDVSQVPVLESPSAPEPKLPVEIPELPQIEEQKSPPADKEGFWNQLLNASKAKGPLFSGLVSSGQLVSMDSTSFTLGFPTSLKFSMENLLKPQNRKTIEDFASEIAGRNLSLQCEIREDLQVEFQSPAPVEEKPSEPMDMADFKNDPLIRKALEIFEAELKQS